MPSKFASVNSLTRLITKITISSMVIGLKALLFPSKSLVKLLSDSLLSDTLLSDSLLSDSLLSDSLISQLHSKLQVVKINQSQPWFQSP